MENQELVNQLLAWGSFRSQIMLTMGALMLALMLTIAGFMLYHYREWTGRNISGMGNRDIGTDSHTVGSD